MTAIQYLILAWSAWSVREIFIETMQKIFPMSTDAKHVVRSLPRVSLPTFTFIVAGLSLDVICIVLVWRAWHL